MKRAFLFFGILFINLAIFAFETNSAFGIKKQDTPEGYQQYVSREFIFRPACGSLETWNNSGFKYSKDLATVPYTIIKVKVKDVVIDNKPNREITIEAVPTYGGQKDRFKEKFKGYEEVSIKTNVWGDVSQRPLIEYMPIYFTKPYRELKESKVGTFITDDLAKDKYKIVDIHFDTQLFAGALCYKTRNQRTGEVKNVFCNMPWMAFEDAYEGRYKTELIKVEKPENANVRYGKTEIITDDGVEKYTFKDDIINIIIFGDQEQFNFILKNVSSHSLKVIWDEASFVGLDGTTSKIKHTGSKYTQPEQSQPATTILSNAKLEDFAFPANNISYKGNPAFNYATDNKALEGDWKIKPMLPQIFEGTKIGEIRLMLPIQIKDVVNEYTFVFNVYYVFDHPELLKPSDSTDSN